MFLDVIAEPGWNTTAPTPSNPPTDPGADTTLLISCVVILLAVTLIMLIVRKCRKKSKQA